MLALLLKQLNSSIHNHQLQYLPSRFKLNKRLSDIERRFNAITTEYEFKLKETLEKKQLYLEHFDRITAVISLSEKISKDNKLVDAKTMSSFAILKAYYDKVLYEQVSTIQRQYSVLRDGRHLNPALEILGFNLSKMENGRWKILLMCDNEHSVEIRLGLKTSTSGYRIVYQDEFEKDLFSKMKYAQSYHQAISTGRSGHPSLGINLNIIDDSKSDEFPLLPIFIGGWLLRNDRNGKTRFQVLWQSGRCSRSLNQKQRKAVEHSLALALIMEYQHLSGANELVIEFCDYMPGKMSSFISGECRSDRQYYLSDLLNAACLDLNLNTVEEPPRELSKYFSSRQGLLNSIKCRIKAIENKESDIRRIMTDVKKKYLNTRKVLLADNKKNTKLHSALTQAKNSYFKQRKIEFITVFNAFKHKHNLNNAIYQTEQTESKSDLCYRIMQAMRENQVTACKKVFLAYQAKTVKSFLEDNLDDILIDCQSREMCLLLLATTDNCGIKCCSKRLAEKLIISAIDHESYDIFITVIDYLQYRGIQQELLISILGQQIMLIENPDIFSHVKLIIESEGLVIGDICDISCVQDLKAAAKHFHRDILYELLDKEVQKILTPLEFLRLQPDNEKTLRSYMDRDQKMTLGNNNPTPTMNKPMAMRLSNKQ